MAGERTLPWRSGSQRMEPAPWMVTMGPELRGGHFRGGHRGVVTSGMGTVGWSPLGWARVDGMWARRSNALSSMTVVDRRALGSVRPWSVPSVRGLSGKRVISDRFGSSVEHVVRAWLRRRFAESRAIHLDRWCRVCGGSACSERTGSRRSGYIPPPSARWCAGRGAVPLAGIRSSRAMVAPSPPRAPSATPTGLPTRSPPAPRWSVETGRSDISAPVPRVLSNMRCSEGVS